MSEQPTTEPENTPASDISALDVVELKAPGGETTVQVLVGAITVEAVTTTNVNLVGTKLTGGTVKRQLSCDENGVYGGVLRKIGRLDISWPEKIGGILI